MVGFLKAKSASTQQIESWIRMCCGQIPLKLQKLDEQVVRLQLSSSNEVDECLLKIAAMGDSSLFSMI